MWTPEVAILVTSLRCPVPVLESSRQPEKRKKLEEPEREKGRIIEVYLTVI